MKVLVTYFLHLSLYRLPVCLMAETLSTHKVKLKQKLKPVNLVLNFTTIQTWLPLDVCRLCWGCQKLWPNQNPPTSTLHYRLTANYWVSDPANIINELLTINRKNKHYKVSMRTLYSMDSNRIEYKYTDPM